MSLVRILNFDRKTFAAGLSVQVRCLRALMIREMMMRYGRNSLGFIWVFIEPMLLCVGVMIIWSLIRDPFEHGLPIVAFVFTGYMPLTLWRHITNKSVRVFRLNSNLLYHRHVTLLDVFFTGIVLEFAGTTTALFLVGTTLVAIGAMDAPHDLGLVVAGWTLMGLLSVGVASGLAILTDTFEIAEKFVQPVQYLMVPLSGFVFMVDWLPTTAQHLALYIPTIHCYEMLRSGFFGGSVAVYYNPWYPAVWGIGLFAVSVGFLNGVRDYIYS
jgi:capsular polysaccharide transport system permease protein